ncbi:MAG TPA: SCO family protein [Longimicrobiales bacterium]
MQRRRPLGFPLAALAAILGIAAGWWALALWPVAGAAPDWLVRTRAACFGVYDDGLPDLAGWLGLIGQPIVMLAILVLGWGRALARDLRTVAGSRGGRLALALSVLALGAGLGGVIMRVTDARAAGAGVGEAAPVPSTAPQLDRRAPPLTLVDQHGDTRSLAELRGRPVLLTFAFAHCETVCPLLVRHVLQAQATLRTKAPAKVPAVVVVTLDPWRDTPSRLPHIAESWQLPSDAYVLSGAVPMVEAALDAWDLPRRRDERTGAVVHPPLVYVLDERGRIAYTATGAVEAETLVELARRL